MIDNQHVGNESCQNSVGESCQNSVGESCHMKGMEESCPNERENDAHEVGLFGSSSRSGEFPTITDEMWHSLEISDESSLDGEVGKRLNQMVSVPVSVALVHQLASVSSLDDFVKNSSTSS